MVPLSHAADMESISRILRVNPVWREMHPAGNAVNLADTTLLHAGPAFSDPTEIVKPVLNSAKVALVFNGAAQDFEEMHAPQPPLVLRDQFWFLFFLNYQYNPKVSCNTLSIH